jgi:3-oxoacyl-[acyl-carrier-protein] synthase-1
MKLNAHLVALAARTPVGLTAESSAAAIRAGVSRVTEHPFLLDADGEPVLAGYDAALGAEAGVPERLQLLAHSVTQELASKVRAERLSGLTIPVLVALPEDRPGFSRSVAADLIRALGQAPLPGGCRVAIQELGRGHAGAFLAMEQAVERLSRGQEELVFVVGVESYLDPDVLDWLDADFRLARPARRNGLPPGEGAAGIALASSRFGKQLGLPSHGMVRAVACTREVRDETAPEGQLGEALTDAYLRVGAELVRPEETFDDFYIDINGERPRTTDLGFALLRAGQLFRSTAYVTSVSAIGDVGAASVPLNCILAARAWARGYASGRTALISGASWTGLRGAALLQKVS